MAMRSEIDVETLPDNGRKKTVVFVGRLIKKVCSDLLELGCIGVVCVF